MVNLKKLNLNLIFNKCHFQIIFLEISREIKKFKFLEF